MTLTRRELIRWIPSLAAMGLLKAGPLQASRGTPRIVVAGGGFGGLNLAHSLKQLMPSLDITVIDQHREFIRCPGSNLVIAGFKPMESLVHHPSSALKREGIRFQLGTISGFDPERRNLYLKDGSKIAYDRLVVAPGIDFRWNTIEGYDQTQSSVIPHAWKAGDQTRLLRDQLALLPKGGVFMMMVPGNPYRCPPGPYERASLVAARLKRVNPRAKVLILDAKSKFSKEKGFKAAWESLYPGMVEWISLETEGEIDHIDAKKRMVVTAFNRYRPDVLNIIPPQKAGALADMLTLTDASGWCPVNPISYESTRIPSVHVIGDASDLGAVPKSAFAAQTEARSCALALALSLGDMPLPAPRLINHCYSLVSPKEAISVTGVYGIKSTNALPETLSLMESPPDADRHQEFVNAMDWFDLLTETTFGNR